MTAMARPALLYFLLWLGVSLNTAMDLQKRIIGGHDCGNNERQFHVSLVPKSLTGKKYICGGSLIRDQWVLTAAHCWQRLGSAKALVNIHPGPPEEIDVIKHKPYREKLRRHDIMLLKLKDKPRNIHTVDLPTAADCQNDIKIGDTFQVAGLGISAVDANNEFLNQFPTKLLCLNDVPVVQCGLAQNMIPNHHPRLPYENAFCAEGPGKHTAPGDSGGGVLFRSKVYGIVAGGHGTHTFVAPFYFVRVCSYLKFINDTINKN